MAEIIHVTPLYFAYRAGRKAFHAGEACPPAPATGKRKQPLSPAAARYLGWMTARGVWAIEARDKRRRMQDFLGAAAPDDEETFLSDLLASRPSR